MSGMEAASAGIALVGFVATTIQQLDKLIRDFQNAPDELKGVLRYLTLIRQMLASSQSIVKRYDSEPDRHGSVFVITAAIECCAETLKSLEALVEKGRRRSKLQRTMTSIVFMLRKEEILGVQNRLQGDMMTLHMAISIDNTHRNDDVYDAINQLLVAKPKPTLLTDYSQSVPSRLTETVGTPRFSIESSQSVTKANADTDKKQLLLLESMVAHQRPLTFSKSSHSTPPQLLEEYQKPASPIESSHSASHDGRSYLPSLDAPRSSRTVSKESATTWYNGMFGTVTIWKKSKYTGRAHELRTVDAESMFEEKVVFFRPSFWNKHYELRIVEHLSRISRTLNVECVVDNGHPIFHMCRSGDITALLGAFYGGRGSPNMINAYGQGLLHFAAVNHQLEMCTFLLNAKIVDVNRVDFWRNKALAYVANQSSSDEAHVDTKTVVEVTSLLARRQEDVSAFDISSFFQYHRGPAQALEHIVSVYLPQNDIRPQNDDVEQYPMLASALKQYAREPSTWDPILRALIRRGVGLHARVRRNPEEVKEMGYPCLLGEYGTPLDELFTCNRDPEAAKMAADGWLRILVNEGCDASSYLETESMLREQDMRFTHASTNGYDLPRLLFFELGDCPSVHWNWWIDPTSSTFRLREEFRCLVTTPPDWRRMGKTWKEHWPFIFPKWSEIHDATLCQGGKALQLHADDRAVRRLRKKKAKLTRAHRAQSQQNVPGAWPLA